MGNPEKEVASSLTTSCCSSWKGSVWVPHNYVGLLYIYIYMYNRIHRTLLTSVTACYQHLIVVYWPSTRPDMPFQKRGSCIFHWRRRAWLIIWDEVKSHGTVRLMHRKRVTCELHDSYFRSMTIKYAIPKTAEVTHPDGQLWGDIEWAIELLYNSVKTGSQLVFGDQTSWRQNVVEKATTQQKGPLGPPIELEIRWVRDNMR